MKLLKFGIENYRSINNSEMIEIDHITALVGRNESGKTNLLTALYNLNPADKNIQPFNKIKDFPRDRNMSEYSDNTIVVNSIWSFSDEEKKEIRSIITTKKKIDFVSISRPYYAKHNISIQGFSDADYIIKEADTEKNIKDIIDKKIISFLPKFIYLEDYPELEGHQNIDQYIQRKSENRTTEKDKYFEKLMKVSGLNPAELQQLLDQTPELRQPLTNRAGAIITKKIRELWKDRALKVRFNLDAGHFDTLISDPNAVYDVEVNLNERSRGFQWFFSFYITFSADTNNGAAKNAILLLDEPGLYLHAVAQRDLLNHFKNDFHNQIIYTTHSPFMVPIDNLSSIRTVNISPEEGTTVTNTPKGDSKTLFPLQAALGYDITQSLFIGEKNIIVEGVTDFWYLTSLSSYFESQNMKCLEKDIVVTPAGGASKITYLVSMLTSQNLKVVTLFDYDQSGKESADDIIKQKLVRDENVLFVNEVLKSTNEMDIEDLIDESLFSSLVNDCYVKELKGITLPLNPKIPRIVIRYEDAFKNVGLEFNKTRVANLFMRKLATDPSTVITKFIQNNFTNLFDIFNRKFLKIESLNRGKFQ